MRQDVPPLVTADLNPISSMGLSRAEGWFGCPASHNGCSATPPSGVAQIDVRGIYYYFIISKTECRKMAEFCTTHHRGTTAGPALFRWHFTDECIMPTSTVVNKNIRQTSTPEIMCLLCAFSSKCMHMLLVCVRAFNTSRIRYVV